MWLFTKPSKCLPSKILFKVEILAYSWELTNKINSVYSTFLTTFEILYPQKKLPDGKSNNTLTTGYINYSSCICVKFQSIKVS